MHPNYFKPMSKQQKGGMRSVAHYVLEFAVILLGITVSVAIEKNNARNYKESVKDQSLSRILSNIRQDSIDYEFNISVHLPAAASCAWMFERRGNLEQEHPDSVGKHCSMCMMAQTIFLDNQEEYRTLQNSGLIELIENDELARSLQAKYVQHEFLRKIEKFIAEEAEKQHDIFYRSMTTREDAGPFMGYVKLRRWNGAPLDEPFLERLSDMGFWHNAYATRMGRRKQRDAKLTEWIRAEIGEAE